MKLTPEIKLQALEMKYYSGIHWEPKKGDYYTTSRADLELYQVVDVDDEFVYTSYLPVNLDNISKWRKDEFTSKDFGLRRVHVHEVLINELNKEES